MYFYNGHRISYNYLFYYTNDCIYFYLPMQNVYFPTQTIFVLCKSLYINGEFFLNDIFGGQTGDKISHIKRKKNNKTTS